MVMPSWEKMNTHSYDQVFWGGDLSSTLGFEALVKRNADSKKMLNDLEEYLKKRSRLESEYSKNLANLAIKSFKQYENVGVLEATLNLLKTELDSMASNHSRAAASFLQHSEAVKKCKEDQTNRRKDFEDSLSKIQLSKLSQHSKTIQAEKQYVKKCFERDNIQITFKEISTSPQSQAKDIEKVRLRLNKASEEAEKADTQYKSAVKVLEDCHQLWENEMIRFCQSIQSLDEERIKLMRQEIWDTVNIDSQLALDIDRSCETIREVLEKCDIVSDIQDFIRKFATGENRPEKFIYKHYTKIQGSNDTDSSGSDCSSPYATIGDAEAPNFEAQTNNNKKFFAGLKKKSTS